MARKAASPKAKSPRRKVVLRDNIQGITSSDVHNLAHRGGVKRIGTKITEEVRSYLKMELERLLHKISIVTLHDKRRLIDQAAVQRGGKLLGKTISMQVSKEHSEKKRSAPAAGGEGKKPHRFRPGTQALRSIRRSQKSSALIIRRGPFDRLVRELLQDYEEPGMRFTLSKDAVLMIQGYIENFLVGLMRHANLAALHAGRQTISPQDFDVVRQIRLH